MVKNDFKKVRDKSNKGLYRNDTYYRIHRNDKVLYKDQSGNFEQINNYYFDNVETTFTKGKLIIVTLLIFLLWSLLSIVYSLVYEISYWKGIFEFADNYVFVGSISLIIFIAFKRKKTYNKIGKGDE